MLSIRGVESFAVRTLDLGKRRPALPLVFGKTLLFSPNLPKGLFKNNFRFWRERRLARQPNSRQQNRNLFLSRPLQTAEGYALVPVRKHLAPRQHEKFLAVHPTIIPCHSTSRVGHLPIEKQPELQFKPVRD